MDWRSFRLDRISEPEPTGQRFRARELPAEDALAFVQQGIRRMPQRYAVRVRVAIAADDLAAQVGRWGTVTPDGDGVRARDERRRPRLAGHGAGRVGGGLRRRVAARAGGARSPRWGRASRGRAPRDAGAGTERSAARLRTPGMRRRTLLALPALGLVPFALLSACSEESAVPDRRPEPAAVPGGGRRRRGDHLRRRPLAVRRAPPTGGPSRGVVVVIHGGFWKWAYDYTLGQPLARSLADRRAGRPGTSSTAASATAAAPRRPSTTWPPRSTRWPRSTDLDLSDGGDARPLRGRAPRGVGRRARGPAGRRHPRDLAGRRARPGHVRADGSRGRGGRGPARPRPRAPTTPAWDPQQQIPLDVPVWCVHGVDDTIVPLGQSEGYVVDAQAAGAQAEIVRVEGDHFVVIDPSTPGLGRARSRSSTPSPDPSPHPPIVRIGSGCRAAAVRQPM